MVHLLWWLLFGLLLLLLTKQLTEAWCICLWAAMFINVQTATDLDNVLDAKAASVQTWIDWSNKVIRSLWL
jgi:hypothetical protein